MVRGWTLLILEVKGQGHNAGLSICLIWGRYSDPFPMQNSIFFPYLDPKFSKFDSLKKNGKVEKKA